MNLIFDIAVTRKASSNLKKHAVSFTEAASVFYDPLSVTYFLVPMVSVGALCRNAPRYEYVRGAYTQFLPTQSVGRRGIYMKTKSATSKDELRSNYEPGILKDGIRGKYIDRLKSGSNLILLEPDVAAIYPDAKKVNSILRRVAQSTARTCKKAA